MSGDIGKLQGKIKPAIDRFQALGVERQDMFKSTLARFNRIYAFITQVCRLFDKDIHKFSVYAKFLLVQLPKGSTERVDIDDKVLLEYYRLEKDFEGSIELEAVEIKDLSRELYRQMKHNDNDVIYVKTVDQHVTIMGYWFTDKHTRGVENVVFSITCEAKKVFGAVNIVMYTIIALKNFLCK